MRLPEDTTFKICIDFFNNFAIQIYKSRFSTVSSPIGSLKMAEIDPASPYPNAAASL